MKNLIRTSFIAIVFVTAPVQAFTALYLDDSPIANFSEQDNQLLIANFRDAMDNNADGETTEWKNEETGVHGSIRPIDTTQENGMTCRRVEVANTARDLSSRSTFKFCKAEGGDWGVAQQ